MKRKTKETQPSADSSGGRRLRRLCLCLGAVVCLVVATYASLGVKQRIENDARFQLTGWTLSFGEFPDWVTAPIRNEIEELRERGLVSAGDEGGTIFRQHLFAHIRDRILENPWVRSVHGIRLSYPGVSSVAGEGVAGGLDVDLELRRPIVAVKLHNSFYLTDADSVRVGAPLSAFRFEEYRLPVVSGTEGLADATPPEPGERWVAREILEGIAVARVLFKERINQLYPRNPIRSIDIRNVGGRVDPRDAEVVIEASGLPPMAWGRSPISQAARTLQVDEILSKLKRVLQRPDLVSGDPAMKRLRLDWPGQVLQVPRR